MSLLYSIVVVIHMISIIAVLRRWDSCLSSWIL